MTRRPPVMSHDDVKALCDAAQAAWDGAHAKATHVRFTWRRRRYYSTLTSFRMLINTEKGTPVASRWHR
jgi:hypothetical protein